MNQRYLHLRQSNRRRPSSAKSYLLDNNIPQQLEDFFIYLNQDLCREDFTDVQATVLNRYKSRVEYFCSFDQSSPVELNLPALRAFLIGWDRLLVAAQENDVAFTQSRKIGSSPQSQFLLTLSRYLKSTVMDKYPKRFAPIADQKKDAMLFDPPMTFDEMADFTAFVLDLNGKVGAGTAKTSEPKPGQRERQR